VRTLSQLKILSSLPEVSRLTLISVSERPVAQAALDALADAVPKLRVLSPVFHPIHIWRFPRRVPRVLILRASGVPYLSAKWDSPSLRRTLLRELRSSPPDVVYMDHLGMARYLPVVRRAVPASRLVLEQHNVESDFFKRFAERQGGVKAIGARAEWRAAVRFEERVLSTVDAVVAISAADADRFRQLTGVRASVVPVVMSVKRRPWAHSGRPHFCFVGSLRWHPNRAGLDWLCQSVWPRIRARVPEATMEIAGVDLPTATDGRPRVPEPWRIPGVTTVGFLDDLESLYARSLAMLAPVAGGSGVRIKVLDALAAGLPVVTTAEGASGLALTDGKEAMIASDEDGFAERAVRLVRDDGLRMSLRDCGYAYLERHHSLAIAQRMMRQALGSDR
jgi:glycosyltransferase involved in cell wall biosynthesis